MVFVLQFSDFTAQQTRRRIIHAPINETCHYYVPHMEIREKDIPRFMDITNHSKRVYLKDERFASKQNSTVQSESIYKAYDSRKFLDLGVAPLQRIINELRSISAESSEEHYDPRSARAAGLVGYCDYLHGGPPNANSAKAATKRRH